MINITRGTGDDGQPKLTIELNNGDLQLFDSVMTKWRFRDGVGLLRFIFTIMSKAENNRVIITDNTGKQSTLEPADSLLEPRTGGESAATQQPPAA